MVIEAAISAEGVLASAVWVAGSLLSAGHEPLPPEVVGVWAALDLPGTVAAERIAAAGRRLAAVLLPDDGQELLGGLLSRAAGRGQRRGGAVCVRGRRWRCRWS